MQEGRASQCIENPLKSTRKLGRNKGRSPNAISRWFLWRKPPKFLCYAIQNHRRKFVCGLEAHCCGFLLRFLSKNGWIWRCKTWFSSRVWKCWEKVEFRAKERQARIWNLGQKKTLKFPPRVWGTSPTSRTTLIPIDVQEHGKLRNSMELLTFEIVRQRKDKK